MAGFSRYHKYTLGTELRQASRAVVTAVVVANSAYDKAPQLLALRAQLDELLLLMRLAKEAKAFRSFAAYAHAVEQVTSVCRQNELFYARDWMSVSIEEFVSTLDAYIRWYNDTRIKDSLGFRSPIEHRRGLGIAA